MGTEGDIRVRCAPSQSGDATIGPDLTSILDTVDLPIVVIGPDCKIARFNRAATALFCLKPHDLGRSPGEAIARVSDLDKLCARVMADGTQLRRDIREGDRWFLLRIAPCDSPDGLIGAVLTFTNMTAFRASLDQAIYEREYTKAILNTVTEPLVLLDPALRIQTGNQAFYTMLKCTRDRIQNVPLCDLGDGIWKTSSLWESLKAIFSHDTELKSIEADLVFPVIGRRTVLVDARRLSRTGDAMLVLAFRDISDRKRAELNANLLASIIESSDDAIVSKDLNGIIVSWNRGAERLFGYMSAEAVGQSIALIIPPDRLDEETQILDRLKRGDRVEHETIRMRKDGARLNISLTISPVRDANGRIVGASKIARDITNRVRQEEALKAANAALEQANADLQQFAYSASHDLQEPLRTVMLYSELLQKTCGDKLGDLGKEFIGHTVQGAERMHNLLKNLRIYTRVSTSDELSGETDAAEALRKALLDLETAIKESGTSINSTHLPRVRMDEFQLEQVFQNLIGNAIRYRSDVVPRVEIAAVRQGEEWLFTVRDNGIGIEQKFAEQIFGMFKRLHTAAKYPGTGMGLAICKRIIERAGGRIWVDSSPGSGSTFYFTVPGGTLAQEASAEH